MLFNHTAAAVIRVYRVGNRMDKRRETTDLKYRTRVGLCPTCAQVARFTFVGEQHWPPQVAQAAGLGPLVHLWVCGSCQTTLTETAAEKSA